jgi:hypothetical protein
LSLLDVAWALEKLAAKADSIKISARGYFNRQVTAVFRRPKARFGPALEEIALIFNEDEIETPSPELQARFDEIGYQIGDFRDEIAKRSDKCPEVVDCYLADLVLGANHEWRVSVPFEPPAAADRAVVPFAGLGGGIDGGWRRRG